MGTILASSLVTKASTLLNDVSNTRWSQTQLLGWMSDAQRIVAIQIPGASNKSVSMQLVAGTRQQIPSDGWILSDVFRNMGMDGNTPGRAIRLISRNVMDSTNPTWHSDPTSTTVINYLYDPNDQTYFWVYPPSPGGNYVQVNYVYITPEVTSLTTTLNVSDVLEPVILDYMMYRAMMVDAEYAPGTALAQQYLQSFMAGVAGYQKGTTDDNPNWSLKMPFDPSKMGSNG